MASVLEYCDPGTKTPLGPRDAGIPLTLDEFEEAQFEMVANQYSEA